jgi:hypothetical protein
MSKTKATSFLILLFLFIFAILLYGQGPVKDHSKIKGLNCSACHKCELPTKDNPCLNLNAAIFLGKGEMLTPQKLPPDTVVIKVLEDQYERVKFPHRKHVHMLETTFDCTECHHFAPPTPKRLACKDCHNPYEYRENIEQIGLKAAYHRRCLTCHVEWSQNTNCELCHASKDKELAKKLAELIPKFKDSKEPEKIVYITRMFTGPYVTFSHTDHTKKKNVYCADCHQKWECVSCHYQTEEPPVNVALVKGMGVHGPCRLCHATIGQDAAGNDVCVKCHSKQEKQQVKVTAMRD